MTKEKIKPSAEITHEDRLEMLDRLRRGKNLIADANRPHRINAAKANTDKSEGWKEIVKSLWDKSSGLDKETILNEEGVIQNYSPYQSEHRLAWTQMTGLVSVFTATLLRFWAQPDLWNNGAIRTEFQNDFWTDVTRVWEGMEKNVGDSSTSTNTQKPSEAYRAAPNFEDLPFDWCGVDHHQNQFNASELEGFEKKLDSLSSCSKEKVRQSFECFLNMVAFDEESSKMKNPVAVTVHIHRTRRVEYWLKWGAKNGLLNVQALCHELNVSKNWLVNHKVKNKANDEAVVLAGRMLEDFERIQLMNTAHIDHITGTKKKMAL